MTRDEAVKTLRRHEKIAHDYMNGVRADHEADYRASTEALIAALTAPAAGEDVDLVAAVERYDGAVIKAWEKFGSDNPGYVSRASDELHAARADLLAHMAPRVPEWRDIEKDPPPTDGTPIDFWCVEHDHKIGHRTVNVFWRDGAWHQPHWGKITGTTPTRWRYAPTAPAPEKGEG